MTVKHQNIELEDSEIGLENSRLLNTRTANIELEDSEIGLEDSRLLVRYHSGGSMKLNACNLLLAHMLYL